MPSPVTYASGFSGAMPSFHVRMKLLCKPDNRGIRLRMHEIPLRRNAVQLADIMERSLRCEFCLVSRAHVMAPLRRTRRCRQRLVHPATHGAVVSWAQHQRTLGQGQYVDVMEYGSIQRLRANTVRVEPRSCSQGDTRMLPSLQYQHLGFSTGESQGHSSSFTSSKRNLTLHIG